MKIVIIGNGILGSCLALELLKREDDLDVILIGPSSREGAGSTAAAAMLNSFAELESGYLDHKVNQVRFAHSQESAKLWPETISWLENRNNSPKLPFSLGTFVISNSKKQDIEFENFESILDALKHFNEPHEKVEPKDVPGLDPTYEGRTSMGVFIPNEGWMDTAPILRSIDSALETYPNFQKIDNKVLEFSKNGTETFRVFLEKDETVDADKIVIANGAAASNFAQQIGLNSHGLGILYGIGSTLRLRNQRSVQTHVVRTPNRGLACGLYSAPYANNEIVVGATSTVSLSPQTSPRAEDVRTLLDLSQRELNKNHADADLIGINTGWRPISKDGVPILGESEISGVYICTGTRRDGWHLAPFIAKELANSINGAPQESKIQAYSPLRKPYRFTTVEESVEKATRHYVSGMFQHGMTTPKGSYMAHIEENYRRFFLELHAYFSLTDFGIPVDLIGVAAQKYTRGEKYEF